MRKECGEKSDRKKAASETYCVPSNINEVKAQFGGGGKTCSWFSSFAENFIPQELAQSVCKILLTFFQGTTTAAIVETIKKTCRLRSLKKWSLKHDLSESVYWSCLRFIFYKDARNQRAKIFKSHSSISHYIFYPSIKPRNFDIITEKIYHFLNHALILNWITSSLNRTHRTNGKSTCRHVRC
jgi:hypothetical protein